MQHIPVHKQERHFTSAHREGEQHRSINQYSSADELLEHLQIDNSEDAWKYLYARYMSRFTKYAKQRGLSHNDAEEAANEALEQLILSIDHYNRAKGKGEGWIWKIHQNKVTDWLRRRGLVQFEELSETCLCPDKDSSPEFHLEHKEHWQAFLRAWKRLPNWAQKQLEPGRPGRRGKRWKKAKELLKRLKIEEEDKNDVA